MSNMSTLGVRGSRDVLEELERCDFLSEVSDCSMSLREWDDVRCREENSETVFKAGEEVLFPTWGRDVFSYCFLA